MKSQQVRRLDGRINLGGIAGRLLLHPEQHRSPCIRTLARRGTQQSRRGTGALSDKRKARARRQEGRGLAGNCPEDKELRRPHILPRCLMGLGCDPRSLLAPRKWLCEKLTIKTENSFLL